MALAVKLDNARRLGDVALSTEGRSAAVTAAVVLRGVWGPGFADSLDVVAAATGDEGVFEGGVLM